MELGSLLHKPRNLTVTGSKSQQVESLQRLTCRGMLILWIFMLMLLLLLWQYIKCHDPKY